MKIQYCSDLHLEFIANSRFVKANPLKVVAPTLIIAGDLMPFGEMHKHADFLSWVSDNFAQTFLIPGNHEYYHDNILHSSGIVDEAIHPNVHLINNKSVELENVKILFTSLWSHISPLYEVQIKRSLNDFHLISYNNKRFTPNEYNALHDQSLSFLEKEIESGKMLNTIIVTHHVPSMENYPKEYRTSAINESFCVLMDNFILRTEPDYWIYGLDHRNIQDLMIGKTQILIIQLGYVAHM